eukprot:3962263-Prymnesium_polylepis.2
MACCASSESFARCGSNMERSASPPEWRIFSASCPASTHPSVSLLRSSIASPLSSSRSAHVIDRQWDLVCLEEKPRDHLCGVGLRIHHLGPRKIDEPCGALHQGAVGQLVNLMRQSDCSRTCRSTRTLASLRSLCMCMQSGRHSDIHAGGADRIWFSWFSRSVSGWHASALHRPDIARAASCTKLWPYFLACFEIGLSCSASTAALSAAGVAQVPGTLVSSGGRKRMATRCATSVTHVSRKPFSSAARL